MIRTVVNSWLSLLMMATLLWGGCISCPKFFMFPTAKKSCCNKTGQCERPAKSAPLKECKRIPLELQNAPHIQVALPAAVLQMETLFLTAALRTPVHSFRDNTPPPAVSPPDLNLINSTFLI